MQIANCFSIIAVTGLAGHAFGSWKSRGRSAMWLRDFLPQSVPDARILTYGYDSKLFMNNSTASIREFSRNFLEALNTARANDTVNLIYLSLIMALCMI